MTTKSLSFISTGMLIIAALTSCNNESGKSFKLTGTIEGITEGKIILIPVENKELPNDTVKIENGQFVFTGNIPELSIYQLTIEGKTEKAYFYGENARMTFTGHADSLNKATISGGKTQDYSNDLDKKLNDLSVKLKITELRKELYPKKGEEPVSTKRKAEIYSILDKYTEGYNQLKIDFINKHPKAKYSALLVGELSHGKSGVEIEKLLNLLDPELATYSKVIQLREKVEMMKQTEVPIDTFISNAHNLLYKVDNNYAGKEHGNVVYLSIMTDGSICALKGDGNVRIIDPKGITVKEFKTNLKSRPSSIAVDKSDNIYVLGTVYEMKEVESRGRVVKVNTPVNVECFVFNSKGAKTKEIKLEGIITATGARVSGSNILIADTRNRLIAVFDSETGAKKSAIEKLRTCCGILDFSIRNDNEILIANLGAFRVESFDFSGKPLISFGQRGTTINDFHGCCNPVSVAFLSNGGIVTVEKDPTRIKVYSSEGAKMIEGIDELVKGCTYIPMIVDANDNIYLASKTGGIIKCSGSI